MTNNGGYSTSSGNGYYGNQYPTTATLVKKAQRHRRHSKRGQMKHFFESLQLLALVLVFCLFTLHYGKALPKWFRHPHFKHVIIIDAGSTGTRCHAVSYTHLTLPTMIGV